MTLHQKIFLARKNKGLTQEELADLTRITVRTVQRIERGENTPRQFTLKAIATALDIPFENLIGKEVEENNRTPNLMEQLPASNEETIHFLNIFYLSSFSYIVLPYIHFLVPSYLLKKRNEQNPVVLRSARKFIRIQISWVIAMLLLFLITLVYNLFQAAWFEKKYPVNYLWPFFIMYVVNAIIILTNLQRVKTRKFK